MEEIKNKIANSGLLNFDLEDLYVKGERVELDIKSWLWQEMIIKEWAFKESLKAHNWSQYQNKLVFITCSVDAIVPNWAYMLITKELSGNCLFCHLGTRAELNSAIFSHSIAKLDIAPFQDARLLLKGCSDAEVPASAYVMLSQRLVPIVKSLMFGEACSNVPVYKRKS